MKMKKKLNLLMVFVFSLFAVVAMASDEREGIAGPGLATATAPATACMAADQLNLLDFPDEMIYEILKNLNYREIDNLAKTSHRLRVLVNNYKASTNIRIADNSAFIERAYPCYHAGRGDPLYYGICLYLKVNPAAFDPAVITEVGFRGRKFIRSADGRMLSREVYEQKMYQNAIDENSYLMFHPVHGEGHLTIYNPSNESFLVGSFYVKTCREKNSPNCIYSWVNNRDGGDFYIDKNLMKNLQEHNLMGTFPSPYADPGRVRSTSSYGGPGDYLNPNRY